MMAFNLILQVALALLFVGGLAGVGFISLRTFEFQERNVFFGFGMAYFVSLCLYTVGAVAVLFLFPWKIFSLQTFTVVYVLLSWVIILQKHRSRFKNIVQEWQVHRWFFFMATMAIILFFLQIYRTSILDEWLHRPIVKSFVENGVFPLVNPLAPDQDYIHSYHYGTQVVSAAIELLTRVGVSEALDIFKLSYFIAALLFFYGILFYWLKQPVVSAVGAFIVLFCASSFFLLDGFAVSHIWGKISWLKSAWPLNTPPSFSLAGITWVNIVLAPAIAFLLEHLLRNTSLIRSRSVFFLGLLFTGFFLISELFALFLLSFFLLFLVFTTIKQGTIDGMVKMVWLTLLLLGGIFVGVRATGGIVGNVFTDFVSEVKVDTIPDSQQGATSQPTGASTPTEKPRKLIEFRPLFQWGYPAEKKILVVWDNPLYYVRNFLLEAVIVVMVFYVARRRGIQIASHPIFASSMIVGLVFPFVLSTSLGTLNLTKMTAYSLLSLHLVGFALLWKFFSEKRYFVWGIMLLFVLGALPGMMLGPNIQWEWFSSKGGAQACSQNPLCYKGELTQLLKKFESEYPGLKKIGVDPKSAKKVVDLTQSYTYPVTDRRVQYIVEAPGLKKSLTIKEQYQGALLDVIFESGEYSILKVE